MGADTDGGAKKTGAVLAGGADVDVASSFDSARVTIAYNETLAGNESSLAMFRYNRTSNRYVPLADSMVHEDNDTVTATTSHFSPVGVFDLDLWKAMQGREVPSGVKNDKNPQILAYLPQGGNHAYGTITLNDVSLDESAESVIGSDGVDSAGNGVPSRGSSFGGGRTCGDDEVYTDTKNDVIDFNLDTCGADDGFFISYNVVGPDPSYDITYRSTNTGITVDGALVEGSVEDCDGDGLTDAIEEGVIPLHNGPTVDTNVCGNGDTDDDGLDDGQEIDLDKKYSDGYAWTSDPTTPNTDGVGFDDEREIHPELSQRTPSDPRKKEYFFAAIQPLSVVDATTERPLTIDEVTSHPYDANAEAGPNALQTNFMLVKVEQDLDPNDVHASVPVTLMLQSDGSEVPSTSFTFGESSSVTYEGRATTDIRPWFSVDRKNMVPSNYIFRERFKIAVESQLAGTKYYGKAPNQQWKRYSVDVNQVVPRLSRNVQFSDKVTTKGTEVALGRSNAIGKASVPFVRAPKSGSTTRKVARAYFWSQASKDARYSGLTLRATENGISAFSNLLDRSSASGLPGDETDAVKTGPFIYRLR